MPTSSFALHPNVHFLRNIHEISLIKNKSKYGFQTRSFIDNFHLEIFKFFQKSWIGVHSVSFLFGKFKSSLCWHSESMHQVGYRDCSTSAFPLSAMDQNISMGNVLINEIEAFWEMGWDILVGGIIDADVLMNDAQMLAKRLNFMDLSLLWC